MKHVRLSKQQTTSVLNSVCNKLGCEVVDLMIAAMFSEFYNVFPERKEKPLTVWIQTHGRERLEGVEVNPLQVVGWFNYFTPICIPAEETTGLRDTLVKVASLRRSIPGNGLPYFSSRFFNERGIEAFADHWPLEVLVNYTGRKDALTDGNSVLTQQMEYDLGADAAEADADLELPSIFNFDGEVTGDGQLKLTLSWSRNILREERVAQWADRIEDLLQRETVDLTHG